MTFSLGSLVRRTLIVLAVSTSMAVVAGCKEEEQDPPFTLVTSNSSDPVGEDAQILGELVLISGCVGVSFEGHEYLIVWPFGTESSLEDGEWLVASPAAEGLLALGDEVELSGGYHAPGDGELPPFPAECETAEIAVVNG